MLLYLKYWKPGLDAPDLDFFNLPHQHRLPGLNPISYFHAEETLTFWGCPIKNEIVVWGLNGLG